MPRRPRQDRPGSWHHVVNRAIAKRPYFETRSDQRSFLALLAAEVRTGRIELHAFSLMTTHFHLLVRSPLGELSEAMRRIQNGYSRRFNRLRRRDGPLIRSRFFSKRADTDLYRRAIVRYIDINPVRAGLVRTSAEYEFGSARAYAGGRVPPWLTTDWVKSRALAITGDGEFSPKCYVRVFGPRDADDVDSLCSLIEVRMGSACDADPLEDLVGSTPHEVRRWMRRQAVLADGHEIGLPVCGVAGLVRALEREVERGGEWLVERHERTWRGSELARVALLRTLCSIPWSTVADLTGWSVGLARRRFREHRAAMQDDAEHAARVERIATSAVSGALAIESRVQG